MKGRTVAGAWLSTMSLEASSQCLWCSETSQRLPQTQIRAGSSGLEPVLRPALCYKTHKDWKCSQHYQQCYNWPQYDKQKDHLLTETLTHEYMLSWRLWVADRIKFTYLSYNRCLIHLISIKTANKQAKALYFFNE